MSKYMTLPMLAGAFVVLVLPCAIYAIFATVGEVQKWGMNMTSMILFAILGFAAGRHLSSR